MFAESLQDYQLLQSAGISYDSPMLKELHTYADFPKSEEWIQKTVLAILDGKTSSAGSQQSADAR